MAMPDDLREHRDQLSQLITELQHHQAILLELRAGYRVFVFTGGEVPIGQCSLGTIAAYLEAPFATDRVSAGEVDRYEHLVSMVMGLEQGSLPPRPRTLRCRHKIAEAFTRMSSEAGSLGAALESAFRRILNELGPVLAGQAKAGLS